MQKGKEEAKLRAQAKKDAEKQKELMNTLFKVAVVAPVLAPGVDPKSVLCPYWKAGSVCNLGGCVRLRLTLLPTACAQCTRGDKCKYSHDEQAGRKGAKLDVYQDRRASPQEETNEDWDDEKLRNVISEKHAGQKIQSQIICKFFIEAVRDKRYGWFWECPNGETCHYRHALPPGFVIEKKKKAGEVEDEVRLWAQCLSVSEFDSNTCARQVEETPLEEVLEDDRRKLGGVGTPVTLEVGKCARV